MSALAWILVGPAGALGALARYGTGRMLMALTGHGAPWGVLAVNLIGAFALGVATGLAPGNHLLLVAGTGFLGAYTTFSTWMIETESLGERRQGVAAVLNVAGPLLAGLALAAAGIAAGTALG